MVDKRLNKSRYIKSNLHPNHLLLKDLSKRGRLDDQLIIKLVHF